MEEGANQWTLQNAKQVSSGVSYSYVNGSKIPASSKPLLEANVRGNKKEEEEDGEGDDPDNLYYPNVRCVSLLCV